MPTQSGCLCFTQSLCGSLDLAIVASADSLPQQPACTRISSSDVAAHGGPGSSIAAARYDPASSQCDPREADPSNRAGSGLMLAMLLPQRFGVPGFPPLRCFGYPADPALLTLSPKPNPPSGKGPCNRRMNMLEALMNHWANDPLRADVRDLLQQTMCTFQVSLSLVDPNSQVPVWRLTRTALQTVHLPALGRRERGLHGNMV